MKNTLGEGETLRSLLDRMVLSGDALDRFVSETPVGDGEPLSTDDNLYLEHATPKGNVMSYHRSLDEMIATLRTYRRDDPVAPHLR